MALQQAGPRRVDFLVGIQRPTGPLRGHLHFVDRSVFVEGDRLEAGFAHRPAGMSGTVIEDIPLSLVFDDRPVVVPGLRVAAGIVNDHALVHVGAERRSRHGITQTRGTMVPADVRIQIIIVFPALEDKTPLMEKVVLLRHETIHHRAQVQGFHVRIHFGTFSGELSPEIIRLSVIVDEDVRVDLLRAFDFRGIPERTGRGLPFRDEFIAVRGVEVQIVRVALSDQVRGV